MKIRSRIKDYTLEMFPECLTRRGELLGRLKFDRYFYFVDRAFYETYKAQIDTFVGTDFCLQIVADERNKNYLRLADYYRALIEKGITRNDCLITFGGGILQDISGFVASTLYRGLRWVFFPTTLLAQADSCIGSKTSINFDDGKNLIGSFYPPDAIFVDPSFCDTLSDSCFRSGLGEVIKFHLLSNPQQYDLLERYLASESLRRSPLFPDIVQSTLEIKKSYFEEDEFDTGRRNLLNYGHCFGHALESASNFSVAHGEAVIVGMGFANLLSQRRGVIPPKTYQEFESILARYYPHFALNHIPVENLIRYLKKDKKRVGSQLTMILVKGIGCSFKADDITEQEIINTYHHFLEIYPLS